MKTSRFTEPQILAILRQVEGADPVPKLCREHGMSTASFLHLLLAFYIYGLFPLCKLVAEAV